MKNVVLWVICCVIGIGCDMTTFAAAPQCQSYSFHYDTSSGKSIFINHNVRTNNFEHPRTFIINKANTDEKSIPAVEVMGYRDMITDGQGKLLTSCFYGVHGEVLYDDTGNMTCPKVYPTAPDKDGNCQFPLPSA